MSPWKVVGTLALVVVSACGGSGGGADTWPDVKIADATGAPTTSGTVLQEGRPAVVAIWATTCAPCKEELPRLQQLAEDRSGIDVVAMNLGDEPGAIAKYVQSIGLDLPVYIDWEGRLAEELGVPQVPATLFVDGDGAIVERHLGALSAEELLAGADRLG